MDIRIVLLYLTSEVRRLAQRWRDDGDRGDVSEKTVTIAVMVALAVGVMAIIAAKVTAKAEGISF
ncbi:hypothetical protein [Glycomyces sp. MUSA5-2]|uniref:hypothetical protein n=1 Tax=Glycomyces sp. MUSA5-2 TaxID=2053002 RepID=UPI0030098C52